MVIRRVREHGFTLLEIMVAVAIVAGLSAAVAPNVLDQIERAKVTRAKADTKTIANAMNAFYNDVGRLPNTWQATGPGTMPTALADAAAQAMSGGYPGGGYPTCWIPSAACWNSNTPFETWLTTNQGGYQNYRGPYLERVRADPWGRAYLSVIVGNGPAKTMGCGNVWAENSVVVLSAGANGVVESPAYINTGFAPNGQMWTYGDDIFTVAQNLQDRVLCPTNDMN